MQTRNNKSIIDYEWEYIIPIAALTNKVLKSHKTLIIIYVLILVSLISLNIIQTLQYTCGYIHLIVMTKDTYWAQFLKFDLDENYNDYLLFPNYRNAHDGIYTPETAYPQ